MLMTYSFSSYVKSGKCFERLYQNAKDLVKNKPELFYAGINSPDNSFDQSKIKGIEFIDAEIVDVYPFEMPEQYLGFDISMEIKYSITYMANDNSTKMPSSIKALAHCNADLSLNLEYFNLPNIVLHKSDHDIANILDDHLLPYISYKSLEKEATAFLDKYYPEANIIPALGASPIVVDPLVLASRFSLIVETRSISEDKSVFGQIYFVDTDATLYDDALKKSSLVHIPKGTILVDPNCSRPDGSINNTIIHECVHWAKHRSSFLLKRQYNSKAACISCERTESDFEKDLRDVTKIMEWQANQLAPRIQMPAEPFKAKAKEYIAEFMDKKGAIYEFEVMEDVISALATAFSVSKLSSKIRLCDLGFDSALGVYIYIDNHYVRPYGFRKGSIDNNQTFSISLKDAFLECQNNPAFRKLTANGDYLFIENHFVYKDPRYLERDSQNRLILSDYARSHMDECCLVFNICLKHSSDEELYTNYLNRAMSITTNPFFLKYDEKISTPPTKAEAKKQREELQETMKIANQMTSDPAQCLSLLLNWRGIKSSELALEIEVSEKTLRRITNSNSTHTLEIVARICLGMHLPPQISTKFIKACGCAISSTNEKHQLIMLALSLYYSNSFESAIDCLAALGVYI